MDAVLLGTKMAINECQLIMSDRGWNCSQLLRSSGVHKSRRHELTKESAFVHAIISASISYSITQACSTGNMFTCGCDQSVIKTSQDFHWAGN